MSGPPRHPALLIVDVQKDFCPGGALPVAEGDRVAETLNEYVRQAEAHGWPVYASRDWHPAVTNHFQAYGGTWPVHCVQGSEGARFHERLDLPPSATIITKGDEPDTAGYSAFEGHTPAGTTLLDDLKARNVSHLFVGGLATDYCVKHSVLDALRAGLEVTLLPDAVAGVDVKPGDAARALAEMQAAGADLHDPGKPLS